MFLVSDDTRSLIPTFDPIFKVLKIFDINPDFINKISSKCNNWLPWLIDNYIMIDRLIFYYDRYIT